MPLSIYKMKREENKMSLEQKLDSVMKELREAYILSQTKVKEAPMSYATMKKLTSPLTHQQDTAEIGMLRRLAKFLDAKKEQNQ
jgi:hypothetical protein